MDLSGFFKKKEKKARRGESQATDLVDHFGKRYGQKKKEKKEINAVYCARYGCN